MALHHHCTSTIGHMPPILFCLHAVVNFFFITHVLSVLLIITFDMEGEVIDTWEQPSMVPTDWGSTNNTQSIHNRVLNLVI